MAIRNTEDDDTDYRDTYEPAWFSQPRGFVDMPTQSAESLNEFLDFYLPLMIDKMISQRRWCFRLPDLEVELIHDLDQPLKVAATSLKMPRKYLDGLRADLRIVLNRALQDSGSFRGQALGVMLIQMAEEAESWLQFWKESTAPKIVSTKVADGEGWDVNTVDISSALYTDAHGINLMTADDTAKFILGKSISEICQSIKDIGREDPEDFGMRILHVEPVFRDDLVTRFLAKKTEMYQRLRGLSVEKLRRSISREKFVERRLKNSKEDLAAALAEPSITFHGAPRHIIRSIVRYGFVRPGQKIGHTGKELDVACGSSYGVGIYSSPDPEVGSWYADWSDGDTSSGFVSPAKMPGMRLLVCATLMGRAIKVEREETRRKEGLFMDEADSHVSPSGNEYIVFDPAQILPCYAIHIDFGAEVAKYDFDEMLERRRLQAQRRGAKHDGRRDFYLAGMDTSPGTLQQQKEARKAAAAKWFPYGFGPYKGNNFVIEEIGSVSDDEEEYGEFQGMRQEKENEFQIHEQSNGGGGGSWFDEYQTVRSTNKQVRLENYSRYL